MPNDQPSATAGLATTWPGLSQLQQLIHNAKLGMQTLETLISTPAAAMATGSPPASIAIVGLGIELAIFLAQTVDAMDDDIETLRKTAENYRASEADVLVGVATVVAALDRSSSAPTPSVTTGARPQPLPTGTRERVVVTTGATK